MSTEVISPVRSSSRASTLDPLLSRSTLTIPQHRPREGSVASNSAGSVRSSSPRPESIAPPIPGFVVASSKRNADFHELFPNIPEDLSYDLDEQTMAALGILTIPFLDITGIEKRMTAVHFCFLLNPGYGLRPHAEFVAPISTSSGQAQGNGNASGDGETAALAEGDGDGAVDSSTGHKATECACGKNGEHYSTVVADYNLPGTPEKIYELMYKGSFLLEFMKNDQKLIDVQISEWTPKEPDSPLVAREMSFIKPLAGGLGPKQTKCEVKDETMNLDFDDYVSVLTTTRTPDVPSGSVFSVKTRMCLTWAGAASTRCVVTSVVDWTGRSFIRAVIDKSAIDGQKQHHQDLEKAMRKYIADHRSEFVPKGVVAQEAETTNGAAGSDDSESKNNTPSSDKERAKPRPYSSCFARPLKTHSVNNIWSLLRPIPEPRMPGDAQALKARMKAEKKGKIDVGLRLGSSGGRWR
ncbi:GRAM domain-containing protein [Rhizoctonia solani]|uniref:GRAM domain-containing protein n=1 Tax=Rhizoctonia solani TaxID=456999 RepID=A0A8H8SVL4_9AGAM|nr:GRAM domain-containing protein [Rhizoctonia solani]QRW18283.1 GRAM domain-containing protein [Rhizoctonia solani]